MRAKWLARVYWVYTKGGDMRVKVRQVGNSLTVTLPKEIALEMNLSSDMEVDLKVRDQVVVLEPVLPTWERLLTEVRRQAAERGLSEADVERALAESRGPRT
jgi:antitoxin component of MazEF toxin-antitoxin module